MSAASRSVTGARPRRGRARGRGGGRAVNTKSDPRRSQTLAPQKCITEVRGLTNPSNQSASGEAKGFSHGGGGGSAATDIQ